MGSRYFLLGIGLLLSIAPVFSIPLGKVEKTLVVDYSRFDMQQSLSDADTEFEKALVEKDKSKKDYLLHNASSKYYIYTSVHPDDISAIIKLARVYDMQNKNRLAKSRFYQALGLNGNDMWANYYFGDFYYKREEYRKALYYFRIALRNGLPETPENMKQMALIYEKFGDIERSNLYYKMLYIQNPSDDFVADKIRELESDKSSGLKYYK